MLLRGNYGDTKATLLHLSLADWYLCDYERMARSLGLRMPLTDA